MTCKEIEKLLDAYVDGELDLVHSLEIERHLPDCPDCLQAYENQQTLKKAFKSEALYFKPPADLEKRLHASLQNYSRPVADRARPRWLLAVAAALVLAAVAGSVIWWAVGSRNEDQLTQEVVAAHIRSLMVDHLADVVSSDQHTVKPWFNGKIDFAPPVQDFADKGFPLLGGRLDYLDQREVATLIYGRNAHKINVFIWPVAGGEKNTDPTALSRQGYNLVYWNKDGMTFWAISDLNSSELGEFVQLLR